MKKKMEKTKILNKSFEIILSKQLESENNNYEAIYCPEDDEYRVHCDICDKLCTERYHENHLKLGTHTNNFNKRQQLKDFK